MKLLFPLALVMLAVTIHASLPAFLQYSGTQVALSVSGRNTEETTSWDIRAEIQLLTFLSGELTATICDYGRLRWQFYTGIRIRI
jgi:hypothetical protein